jgi:GxxExxY protein
MGHHRTFTDPETYAIIGAAMEVHRTLGCGFLESVYRRALAIEFELRKVPFAAEVPIDVVYKGDLLPNGFRADFICHASVIVEVKSLGALGSIECAQVLNYLKATALNRAILLNFGTPSLQHRRFVRRLALQRDPLALGDRTAHDSAHVVLAATCLTERPHEPACVPDDGDGRRGSADAGRE